VLDAFESGTKMKMRKLTFKAGVATLLFCAACTVHAETVYEARDASGRRSYTNTQPGDPRAKAILTVGAVRFGRADDYAGRSGKPDSPQRPGTYNAPADPVVHSFIRQAAARHALDPLLLQALIHQESRFNPRATSSAGARGLMQLMPGTASRYGVSNIYDPGQNIAAGSAYLRDLLDQFGSVSLALAAYNAGEGAVLKYGRRIPPYAETQNYVEVIVRDYRRRREQPR
jgi:soluble lytic murein transglycosylase-like protein